MILICLILEFFSKKASLRSVFEKGGGGGSCGIVPHPTSVNNASRPHHTLVHHTTLAHRHHNTITNYCYHHHITSRHITNALLPPSPGNQTKSYSTPAPHIQTSPHNIPPPHTTYFLKEDANPDNENYTLEHIIQFFFNGFLKI